MNTLVTEFGNWLKSEERSNATVEKYLHNVSCFMNWLGEEKLDKESMVQYKKTLTGSPSTINGVIAAMNSLACFLEHPEWKLHQVKTQRTIYRPKEQNLTKQDYERLILTAEKSGRKRLARIIETLGSTGMRVSELKFLTAEALNDRKVDIKNKGKLRTILLTADLIKKLRKYCKECGLKSGPIFVTKSGKVLARTQIWTEIKKLCRDAGVDPRKGFPHNFRHLFAVIHHRLHRNLAMLADILGHSNINTTRIYLMDSGEEHLRQLEAMHMVI